MRGLARGVAVGAILLLISASGTPATADDDNTIAEGHIVAGTPAAHSFLTFLIGLPPGLDGMPWSFTFDPSPAAGEWIEPSVIDNGGASYMLRFFFYDASQHRIEAECEGMEGNTALLTEPYGEILHRERCIVPEDAQLAVAAADLGALLDVRIMRTA